ncbi:septal ring lytic transglycosylase RlpA family protein [Flavobacterium cerinum]|uniref:Probable endolytic peptidoglycan transglycosylase RlpA n=1 Tax=Flavobacterium cerinum TaxID=2502784 RepID=A0ABY5IXA6_9FLAO|nr:septal ring lytic transglycosylase RlpA family protein [Flavobacterium cerinum]UUC46127.1 septal ring lytic transglycosylase RlpA family protein [Flavobacterium cerinum]
MKKVIVYIVFVTLAVLLISTTSGKVFAVQADPKVKVNDTIKKDSISIQGGLRLKNFKKNVHASYYADRFNGRRTASGRKFDNAKYTAAHRNLPFGTKIKVTNVANKKAVIVEVIDRGPFTRGREIDLSKKAFMEITHGKGRGFVNVNIEVIQD